MLLGRPRPKGQPNSKIAAGWSALRELAGTALRERSFFRSSWAFLRQHKSGGFACVSCAWTKPAKPQLIEICESGGKARAWELTRKRSRSVSSRNLQTACGHSLGTKSTRVPGWHGATWKLSPT